VARYTPALRVAAETAMQLSRGKDRNCLRQCSSDSSALVLLSSFGK
jgi:hypothetical protein